MNHSLKPDKLMFSQCLTVHWTSSHVWYRFHFIGRP